MNLLDYLKPNFKEDVNLADIEIKVTEALALNPEKVKEYLTLPENKSVFDFVAQKAVQTHIDKEKVERVTWEAKRSGELLEEAKASIAKENQKSDADIRMDAIEKEASLVKAENLKLKNRDTLLSLVKDENLLISDVDTFLHHGENAAEKVREFATKNSELVEATIKKIALEKFGNGGMGDDTNPGGNDTPNSTATYLKESGITN